MSFNNHVHLDTLLVNSRWPDINRNSVDPPEVVFVHPLRPERNVSNVVAMMRREPHLRRSTPAHTFWAMLEKMSTVKDIHKIPVEDDGAIANDGQLDEIPTLRQRIPQTAAAGVVSYAVLALFGAHRRLSTRLHRNHPLPRRLHSRAHC